MVSSNKALMVLALLLISVVTICYLAIKATSFAAVSKDPVVLMVFNGVHDREAANLLASLKQNAPALLKNINICVSDANSKAFAIQHHLQSFELTNISTSGDYGSAAFNIMTQRKMECITYLLAQDLDVLYVDTDIVFLADPIPLLNANYALNIQSDECSAPYKNTDLCTGFMYIQANQKTLAFFKEIVAIIAQHDYKINDQQALNKLLAKTWPFGISVNVLDVCQFPNGCRYFDHTDSNCKRNEAIIVHNNYLVGIENKLARFKEYGLIFS
jgi:Nucleotide-diphospho-sugar transferase